MVVPSPPPCVVKANTPGVLSRPVNVSTPVARMLRSGRLAGGVMFSAKAELLIVNVKPGSIPVYKSPLNNDGPLGLFVFVYTHGAARCTD